MRFLPTLLLSVIAAAVAFVLGLLFQIPTKFLLAPATAAACAVLAGRRNKGMTGAAIGGVIALLLAAIITGVFRTSFMDSSQVGKLMDISGPTLTGQHYDIKTVKAKVYLVDFWATWCGPCVAEVPNIKRVYEEFHPRGLEVVGVSLDMDRKDLAAGVEALRIPWPQIVSEKETGWETPLAKKYGVMAIPALFLLDSQHKILAQSVRGPALRPAVEAAFQSAEQGTPFKNNAEQILQLSPAAIIACPMLMLLGAFAGCFLELRFNRQSIPELDQIHGTNMLEAIASLTEIGWIPLLLYGAQHGQIPLILYAFTALLVLYVFCQWLVMVPYLLGKPEAIQKLAGIPLLPAILKHDWILRVQADALARQGKFKESLAVYESIIKRQKPHVPAPALVRTHLALILQLSDNPREAELRHPIPVLSATAPHGGPADLARAQLVAIIAFSITVFGTWLVMAGASF